MGEKLDEEHERDVPNVEVKNMTAGYGGIVNGKPVDHDLARHQC